MKLHYLKRILQYTAIFGICGMLFSGNIFADSSPKKIAEEPIAPGVLHQSYEWGTYYGNIHFDVLKCDLYNSNLDLRLVAGAGEYTRRATVSAMANRTDAVALLNGDFFNMGLQGSPIGPSIVNNRLQSSPANIQGIYSLGIDQNNTAYIEAMRYDGMLTASDGATYPIDGLNKTYYWHDPSGQESHTGTIQLYNDFWGSSSRGHATNTEVLVNSQGVVEKISDKNTFPFEVPDSKYILQVNGAAETFIKQHCTIGSTVHIRSNISPDRNWKFLVGGHALLADEGHMVPYTKDLSALAGVRARSAAAISQDGKTLWFICAEGRTARSAGIHLSSLGYFIESIGGYRAVNLDGGGSTTMVLKHLGEFERSTVIAPEGNGYQRAVVNGIGIFNSTPESAISGYSISGPEGLIIGETGLFNVDKAWDMNFHPKSITSSVFKFTNEQESMGAWSGQYFVALQPGNTTIRVESSEGVMQKKNLTIYGTDHIRYLTIKNDKFLVENNSDLYVNLYATLNDGRTILVSPKIAKWSIEGFEGLAQDGSIHISDCKGLTNGKIVAEVGSLRAETILGNNEYNLLDLYIDKSSYWFNGKEYVTDQPPIIINNRTMVPIRLISESLGGDIQWNKDERCVYIKYNHQEIKLPINSETIFVNGESVLVDTPAQIVNSRTVVPIRFVSEALGMNVEYNASNKVVSINSKKI